MVTFGPTSATIAPDSPKYLWPTRSMSASVVRCRRDRRSLRSRDTDARPETRNARRARLGSTIETLETSRAVRSRRSSFRARPTRHSVHRAGTHPVALSATISRFPPSTSALGLQVPFSTVFDSHVLEGAEPNLRRQPHCVPHQAARAQRAPALRAPRGGAANMAPALDPSSSLSRSRTPRALRPSIDPPIAASDFAPPRSGSP